MEKFKNLPLNRKITFVIFSSLSLFILWFIFSHSAKPAVESSADSDGLSQLAAKILNSIFGTSLNSDDTVGYIRILAHITEFGALAYTSAASFESIAQKNKICFKVIFPFVFLIAVIDETIQIAFEGRAFQFIDILFDSFGGILGLLFFAITLKIVYKLQKR